MANDFADFAEVASRGSGTRPDPVRTQFSKIAVLGGGSDARLLAALALAEGQEVTLFSAYGAELEALRASSGVTLRGAGPVGTYHVDRPAGPSIRLTAELDSAVRGAEAIYLTGPIHKIRTYAMVLADHLADGQVLFVTHGRTFGALETRWMLSIGGCQADILVEDSALPYWVTAEGAILTLSDRSSEDGADLRRSFADLSGVVDIPALCLGGAALRPGGPSVPMGGAPLALNNSFANLIGPEQARVIADLVAERRHVAEAYGIRDLLETEAWVSAFSGAPKGSAARPVPGPEDAKALIRDGVIGSLVPLVSAAHIAGRPAPLHEAMIALASSVLGADLATAGRKLPSMGFDGDLSQVRRALEAATGGL